MLTTTEKLIDNDPILVRAKSTIDKAYEEAIYIAFELYARTGSKLMDEKLRIVTDNPEDKGLVEKWLEVAEHPAARNQHNQLGITIIKNKYPTIGRLNQEMIERYNEIIARYEVIIKDMVDSIDKLENQIVEIPKIKDKYEEDIKKNNEKYELQINSLKEENNILKNTLEKSGLIDTQKKFEMMITCDICKHENTYKKRKGQFSIKCKNCEQIIIYDRETYEQVMKLRGPD